MEAERFYVGNSITNESKRNEIPLDVWRLWTNCPGELGDNGPHKISIELCKLDNEIIFHVVATEESTGGVYFTNYRIHVFELLGLLAEGKKEVKHIPF